MAGTSHPGSTSIQTKFGADAMAPFIGVNGSGQGGVVFNQWTNGGGGRPDAIVDFPQLFAGGGTVTAAGGTGNTPGPATAHPGDENADACGFGQDWFERVHMLPKTKIDFGNIITQVEDSYELYNAFRRTSVTLTDIVNNVAPGVEFPDVSLPVVLPPQTSMLDSSTTDNSGGTGLGTLVKNIVRALEDGLPVFDSNAVFDTDQNDVELLLAGQRLVLVTAQFDAPVEESMAFLTDIIEVLDGGEQRLALRKQPREGWKVNFTLNGDERQRMQALLFDWQDNLFGLPMWHEQLKLTAAVSAGATQYQVLNANSVDFRVGGLAVVFQDPFTFDVLNITAATDTLITAASPSVNAYSAGALVVPVRVARLAGQPAGQRFPVNVERFQLLFESTDNDTGAPAGSSTAWNANTYNGRVLLDECNVVRGPISEQFPRRIITIDNATGVVTQSSPWDRHKRVHQKGFVAHTRTQIKNLKALLRYLRGRQKAFYIPTFIEDLEVKATLGSGASIMDVTHIGYNRFVKERHPKRAFRITFTDDTSLVREITASSVIDSSTERLTLDTTWPATRLVSEVKRVQFFELVRFDTDLFTLTLPRAGLASMFAPVRVVFDDD